MERGSVIKNLTKQQSCHNISGMSINEIETAIKELPVEQVAVLMKWIEDYHARIWDEQIADDFESGKLDELLAEVEEEYLAGLSQEI